MKDSYLKYSGYEGRLGEVKRVLLLYSGGVDTSLMIKWIKQEYRAEVLTLTVDLGQQQLIDLQAIERKALALGASQAITKDAKQEFAYHYVAQGIKANAQYQGDYHLATPLGRALLAKIAVDVARSEGCDCIAHGCAGKGNDQIRLEGTILTLAPELKVIAPAREWGLTKEQQLSAAKEAQISLESHDAKPYSYDDNLWGISAEGGEIENPRLVPPLQDILLRCSPVEKTPDTPQLVELQFFKGIPVKINHDDCDLVTLIQKLNDWGARHGVGVIRHIEDRVVGLKVRGIYEAPGAHCIIEAHKELEKLVCTRQENEFKALVDQKWGALTYGGLWLEPLMGSLNSFIDKINERVSGTVTLKLFKGRVEVISIETPQGAFDEKAATFMKTEGFNRNASTGFIEIYTMQMRLAKERERCALVSIGGNKNKTLFGPRLAQLQQAGFVLYATAGTHDFLKSHGIRTILVHKATDSSVKPNLVDLLQQNQFDVIVNVPSPDPSEPEKRDGQVIREHGLQNRSVLITEFNVLCSFIDRIPHFQKRRS